MLQSGKSVVRYAALAASLLLLAISSFACGSGSDAPDSSSPQSKAAVAKYHVYLDQNSKKLTHWAETILFKMEGGEINKAGSRYAASRIPLGRIRPAAELIEPLNAQIDSTDEETPPKGTGFNELEHGIFLKRSPPILEPLARRVLADVRELRQRLAAAPLRPAEIVKGANERLAGIIGNALVGKEEPLAANDLVDVAAGLEGLEAAVKAVEPVLKEADPDLVKELQAQFKKAYVEVGEWGIFAKEPEQQRDQEPGISFVVYNEFSDEQISKFSKPVEALAPLLEQAEEELSGN